jgi:hypothetical protein
VIARSEFPRLSIRGSARPQPSAAQGSVGPPAKRELRRRQRALVL